MSVMVTCPGCKAELKVKDEYAGKKLKCPVCTAVVPIPAAEVEVDAVEENVVEGRPGARASAKDREHITDEESPPRRRHAADEDEAPRGRKHRHEDEDDDEAPRRKRRHEDDSDDDGDRRGRKGGGTFVPCPQCGAARPEKVKWTAWGSFYGPSMFNHVRCRECGYAYNGRSGKSNLIPAILFVSIPLILIGVLVTVMILFLLRRGEAEPPKRTDVPQRLHHQTPRVAAAATTAVG